MWLTNVEIIAGNDAGTMNGSGARRLLLHSTEGRSIEGAVAAYASRNVWPHLTVDCPHRRVVQHLSLDVAARSLLNLPGGVQTNKEGDVLVQIEMVGFAGDPSSLGDAAALSWFGAEVVAPICRAMRIPVRSTVHWAAYPGSYGVGAPQRLSPSAWMSYSGLLGHQHVPENEHGDPGAIDIVWVLVAASPPQPLPVPQEEDDMFLYSTPGKPVFFCHAGKSVGINEPTDLSTFVAAEVPMLKLDNDTFAKFRAAYPGG